MHDLQKKYKTYENTGNFKDDTLKDFYGWY